MSFSHIKNVSLGEASIKNVLSITGVHTCLAVVAILNDSRTFMFHADSSTFNLENTQNIQHEVQKLIKKSITMFHGCRNKNNSSFQRIFIAGGTNTNHYKLFNKEIVKMRENYSAVTPLVDGLNINELKEFLQSIEYSNTVMKTEMPIKCEVLFGFLI